VGIRGIRTMKEKYTWNIFFFVVCMMMSCNDPVADKYQKTLQLHPTILSQTLPDYYLNLFQQKARGKIKLITSLEHVGRDTVCNFLYDRKYYVAVYMLSRSYDFSLQNFLQESFIESSVEFGIPFYDNNINSVGIRHRVYVNDSDNNKPSNIFISFAGEGFSRNKKNDTIADYFFKCKNLSIKYKATGHQEVFVEANGYEPLEVMFLKKEKKLFLIFITTKKESMSFDHAIGISLFNLNNR
jgi:hypothetical protein